MSLPFGPDWRWMLERKDSPCYPAMRLDRQPQPGDRVAVIGDMRRDLEDLLAAEQGRAGARMESGKEAP